MLVGELFIDIYAQDYMGENFKNYISDYTR